MLQLGIDLQISCPSPTRTHVHLYLVYIHVYVHAHMHVWRLRAPIKSFGITETHAKEHFSLITVSYKCIQGYTHLETYLKVKLLVTVEDQNKPPQLVAKSLH